VGSPYCVRRYEVDENLGGRAGLAAARRALARRDVGLVLDFVPNHVAPDHPWVADHPEYFVAGDGADLERDPASFRAAGGRVFACGRDPFYPAWSDVLQLDAFSPRQRDAAIVTLVDLASQCDGVRCDMAMLLLDDVFARTWSGRVGPPLAEPFWREVIGAVRRRAPAFRFLAEAYWDREWDLMRQGFDFCYDKRLLDRLERGPAESVRLHLTADPAFQQRLVRFLENHDEPRAAAVFSPAGARAAAVAFATLPGARLFHDGQLEGRRVRLPVFLGRRPAEAGDAPLRDFYRKLLHALAAPVLRGGEWRLLERSGWPDNRTCENLVAWSWELGAERRVVVVNLSDAPAQGRVRLPWLDLAGRRIELREELDGPCHARDGDELLGPGLYVDLAPRGYHLFALGVRRS